LSHHAIYLTRPAHTPHTQPVESWCDCVFQGKVHKTNKVFDEREVVGEPFKFLLGEGQVIRGWEQGLLGYVLQSPTARYASCRSFFRVAIFLQSQPDHAVAANLIGPYPSDGLVLPRFAVRPNRVPTLPLCILAVAVFHVAVSKACVRAGCPKGWRQDTPSICFGSGISHTQSERYLQDVYW
jgi:hypothetical protein